MRYPLLQFRRKCIPCDKEALTDLVGLFVEAVCEVQPCDLELQLFVSLVAFRLRDLDGYVVHAEISVDDSLAVELVK